MMWANWQYLKYIVRHKWFVWRAGTLMGASTWLMLIHDWSKFRPSEWGPYRDYFYRKDDREFFNACSDHGCAEAAPYGYFQKDRFNIAWLHHQRRNKHHWQYWVLKQDDGPEFAVTMPKKYIVEMVADWAGAGKAISGKWEVWDWYKKNREKIVMRSETETQVEAVLESFRQAKMLGF